MSSKVLVTGLIACLVLLAPIVLYGEDEAQNDTAQTYQEPRFIWRTSLTEDQVARVQAFSEQEVKMTTLRIQPWSEEATATVFLRTIDAVSQ